MGGQDGNRGYLIQAVAALLTSLSDSSWQSVSLEPDISSDKVDIFWTGPSHTKAAQVKSSINQINKPDATRWATELKTSTTADSYELVLVGPSSAAVARLGSHDGVVIPCPKNLDIEGLLNEAAHLLDKFLAKEEFRQTSATQREMMVHAIVTKLSAFSTRGRPVTRQQLVSTLKEWLAPSVTSASAIAGGYGSTMVIQQGISDDSLRVILDQNSQLIDFVLRHAEAQVPGLPEHDLIWRLIEDIKTARRRFEVESIRKLIGQLDSLWKANGHVWPKKLRYESIVILAEDERGRLSERKKNCEPIDLSRLKELLSELEGMSNE